MGIFRALPPLALIASACALASPPFARAEDGGTPGWMKKRESDKKKKEKEEEDKQAEQPIVGTEPGKMTMPTGPATGEMAVEVGAPEDRKIEYNLLFNKKGLTDVMNFGFGMLSQPEMGGFPASIGYGMGWWWKPELVLFLEGNGSALFAETYAFWMLRLGPSLRYFAGKNWAFTANVSFGLSEGLSRVAISHIPTPPNDDSLRSRRGLLFTGQAAYLFWKKRDFALGPALTTTVGAQGERSVFEITLGLTYQDGKPNYTGDVTGF